ncbi:hypothetical protein BGZ75_001309, partial [Mortierella antarctica]
SEAGPSVPRGQGEKDTAARVHGKRKSDRPSGCPSPTATPAVGEEDEDVNDEPLSRRRRMNVGPDPQPEVVGSSEHIEGESSTQKCLYDRLEREEVEMMAARSRTRNNAEADDDIDDEEVDGDIIVDATVTATLNEGLDIYVDPEEQSAYDGRRGAGVRFEALLDEMVFSKELEEYFRAMEDANGAPKVLRTRAQQREDEVSHAQLLTKHAALAENSKNQYLAALRIYKIFCDRYYCKDETEEDRMEKALRYEVTVAKALVFMEDVMFKRTRAKYFQKGTTEDFNGPVSFMGKDRRGRSDPQKKEAELRLME